MERSFDDSPLVYYHLVGKSDVSFLKEIKPSVQAIFLRHPHYQVAMPIKTISFSSPKIKIINSWTIQSVYETRFGHIG